MKTQNTIDSAETITSNPQFQIDWALLGSRAFRMREKAGHLLKQLYVLLTTLRHAGMADWLRTIKDWQLVPYTLWPIDVTGLGKHVCREAEQGKALDEELAALLHLIKNLPSETEQEAIGRYEHCVEAGNYDLLVRDDAKYLLQEKKLLENPEFHSDLQWIDQLFDLDSRCNDKGIVRRTMVCERNFRIAAFFFNWANPKSRFQHVFDAFCWKWELYGLEKRRPLLMQVSVNPTAHGLMIFVPKWMNVDFRRDLLLTAIAELQKARGTLRQGPKISESRLEREEIAKRVYLADRAAKDGKLSGEKRRLFIVKEAKLPPRTDMRRIREWIKLGAFLLTGEVAGETSQPINSLSE